MCKVGLHLLFSGSRPERFGVFASDESRSAAPGTVPASSGLPVASQRGAGQPRCWTSFFEGFDLRELLRATAWRTSALKADSSTSSPSWMSIARRTFPSRLELKRRAGSFRDAPLEKVSFTTFL